MYEARVAHSRVTIARNCHAVGRAGRAVQVLTNDSCYYPAVPPLIYTGEKRAVTCNSSPFFRLHHSSNLVQPRLSDNSRLLHEYPSRRAAAVAHAND